MIPIEIEFKTTEERDKAYVGMIEDANRPSQIEIWKEGDLKIKGEIRI